MGKQWRQWETFFSWAPKSLRTVTAAMKLKDACSLEETNDKPRQYIKKQGHPFANKVCLGNAMGFPIVMDGYESWTIKKAECWRINTFELWCWRGLLSPLDCKEIKPVNSKGNQSWIFTGRTDAEAEAPVRWSLDAKCQFIRKDSDIRKDWRQEKKGMTEDEMVG